MGQEKRVGDQMCEPEDRALHHHQRFLVHHQALELDSPVCQARLPRQLDKVSRLCCHLDTLAVTVADPVMVTVADLEVVAVGDLVMVAVADLLWVMQVGSRLVQVHTCQANPRRRWKRLFLYMKYWSKVQA